MNKNEIMAAIAGLARSQGFYGRLLEALQDNPEALEHLAEQQFETALDLVLYLEG